MPEWHRRESERNPRDVMKKGGKKSLVEERYPQAAHYRTGTVLTQAKEKRKKPNKG